MPSLLDFLPPLRVLEPRASGRLIVVGLSPETPLCSVPPQSLDAAMAAQELFIDEVAGGGQVPTVEAHNRQSRAVLGLAGEEIVGARQNRILNTSVLLQPHTKTRLPVSCVEQGRWQQTTRSFAGGGTIYFPSAMRTHVREVTQSYRTSGQAQADQGRVWQDVQTRLTGHGVASQTRSVHQVFEQQERAVSRSCDTELPPAPGQHGFIFFLDGRLAGLHLFPHADFCSAVWRKHVISHLMDADTQKRRAVSRNPTSARPPRLSTSAVSRLLEEIRHARCESFAAPGGGEDLRFSGPDYAGQALVVDRRLVHLAVFP